MVHSQYTKYAILLLFVVLLCPTVCIGGEYQENDPGARFRPKPLYADFPLVRPSSEGHPKPTTLDRAQDERKAGNYVVAEKLFKQVIKDKPLSEDAIAAYSGLNKICAYRSQSKEANDYLDQAIALTRKIQYKFEWVRVCDLSRFASLKQSSGRFEEARSLLKERRTVLEKSKSATPADFRSLELDEQHLEWKILDRQREALRPKSKTPTTVVEMDVDWVKPKKK